MTRPLSRCSARCHRATWLLFAASLWAFPPGSARACELQLEGEPSAAWQEAVRELPPAPADDCSSLILRVEGGAARLIFATQDGRRAERALAGPDELAASIAALRVTGPSESTPAPAASASPPQVSDTKAPASQSREVDALGTLLTGVRVGQDTWLSPTLGGSLLARIRDWELGALATWETGYYALSGGDSPRRSGFAVTSLTFARRQPVGRFALLGGVRLGMAVLLQSAADRPAFTFAVAPASAPGIVFHQPRLQGRSGAFVGFAVPRAALARLRFELGIELGWPRQFYPPNFMFWAFTFSVGLELGRP